MNQQPQSTLDLAALFEQHQHGLLGLALRITGDFALAEDALQETFLCAHAGARSFRGEARPGTWLYRIAVRESLRVRSRARRVTSLNQAISRVSAYQKAEHSPMDRLAWVETTWELLRALELLPEDQRLALVLLSTRELTAEDVGAMFGIAAGTVYTRAFRARLKLRSMLRGANTLDSEVES